MDTPHLQLLRRHGRACPKGHPFDSYTSEHEERRKGFERCDCALVVGGTLKGVYRKKSTKVSDWETARLIAAAYAAAGTWDTAPPVIAAPAPAPPPPPVPSPAENTERRLVGDNVGPQGPLLVSEAIPQYLEDHRKQGSAAGTLKRYRLVLAQFERFAAGTGLIYLGDWSPRWVRQLRDSWEVSPLTRDKKLAVIKPFFEFFVQDEYLLRNPARVKSRRNVASLRGEDSTAGQKHPFVDAEVERMIAACDQLGKSQGLRRWPKKQNGRQVVAITEYRDYARKITGEDLKDFIWVSIYTGLRISDVAIFDISRLTPQGIRLRARKNGQPICVPIPEWLQDRIRWRAQRYGAKIFRPTGNGIDAITQNWRRPLNDLWKTCGPWDQKPTPHRFRHTFVRILLDRRLIDPTVTLALIAELVGDTEDMIRKHYKAWMGSQQETITRILEASFAKVPRLS